MAIMTHRTTFALDETTAHRLKRLAALWKVSQAEVVRRSVERAEQSAEAVKPDPIAMLRKLHEKGGGIAKERADRWVAEIYKNRKRWRVSS